MRWLRRLFELGARGSRVPADARAELAISLLVPAAMRGGFSEADLAKLPRPFDTGWVVILAGGDNASGIFRNLDLCPCHQCYNVAENPIPLPGIPNPAQIPAMLAYLPDPPPEDRCPEGCLHVKTHHWRGWYVIQHQKTGAVELHCNSFAQYHCVLPDDPEGRRPAKDGPPEPEPDDPEA